LLFTKPVDYVRVREALFVALGVDAPFESGQPWH
jgi:hypothetical protein